MALSLTRVSELHKTGHVRRELYYRQLPQSVIKNQILLCLRLSVLPVFHRASLRSVHTVSIHLYPQGNILYFYPSKTSPPIIRTSVSAPSEALSAHPSHFPLVPAPGWCGTAALSGCAYWFSVYLKILSALFSSLFPFLARSRRSITSS